MTGRDSGELYRDLATTFGEPVSAREDAPATPEQQAKLRELTPSAVPPGDLAGEPITSALTTAPGNGEPLGGLKETPAGGWFAARPSGTEPVYKVYAESFRGPGHLTRLLAEARRVVAAALGRNHARRRRRWPQIRHRSPAARSGPTCGRTSRR